MEPSIGIMLLTGLTWPYKINVAGKTEISSVEVSTRLTSHGMLLYCEGWGVLGETTTQIHIAKKSSSGAAAAPKPMCS